MEPKWSEEERKKESEREKQIGPNYQDSQVQGCFMSTLQIATVTFSSFFTLSWLYHFPAILYLQPTTHTVVLLFHFSRFFLAFVSKSSSRSYLWPCVHSVFLLNLIWSARLFISISISVSLLFFPQKWPINFSTTITKPHAIFHA